MAATTQVRLLVRTVSHRAVIPVHTSVGWQRLQMAVGERQQSQRTAELHTNDAEPTALTAYARKTENIRMFHFYSTFRLFLQVRTILSLQNFHVSKAPSFLRSSPLDHQAAPAKRALPRRALAKQTSAVSFPGLAPPPLPRRPPSPPPLPSTFLEARPMFSTLHSRRMLLSP